MYLYFTYMLIYYLLLVAFTKIFFKYIFSFIRRFSCYRINKNIVGYISLSLCYFDKTKLAERQIEILQGIFTSI